MVLGEKAIDRFWTNVDVKGGDECWPWLRYCNQDGYGRFKLNGKYEQAHRVAWTLANGLIPELFEDLPSKICHSCDNPPCCNPNHLFLGNQLINLEDSAAKGRQSYPQPWSKGWCKGENHPKALKTEVEIKEIKLDLRENVLTHKQIAEKFGVSRPTISLISRGETWSHIMV